MKYLLSFLLIFLFSTSIRAQEWVSIGQDRQGEDHLIYTKLVNSDDSEGFGVWVKYQTNDYSTVKGKKIVIKIEVKQLMQIKCSSNEIAVVQTVVYNAKGDVVRSSKSYPEFSAVIPDSMGELVVNAACSLNEGKNQDEVPN